MQIPKLKVKVYFYHLFMLAIVMLLCFYLVYRDMKRIENNVLGIFKRVGNLENNNKLYHTKIDELLEIPKSDPITTQCRFQELQLDEINIVEDAVEDVVEGVVEDVVEDVVEGAVEDVVEGAVEDVVEGAVEDVVEGAVEDVVEGAVEDVVDNMMKSVINLHENVLEKINDNKDFTGSNSVDADVDGVMDLLDTIENKEEVIDFGRLNQEELLEKTNGELKEFLKLNNLSITGNKKKMVDAILNLNK